MPVEGQKWSDEAPEPMWLAIKRRHRLTACRIFELQGVWRVIAFRNDTDGFQAFVEDGRGPSIAEAINDLDDKFRKGPARKRTKCAT